MFHNVLMTSLTPLRNTHESSYGWPSQPFTGIWPEDNTSKETKRVVQKKSKRHRTAFTTDQILELEYYYRKNKYVSAAERERLARSMNLTNRTIKVWFQNRRMKEKKSIEESSESSSECASNEVSPPPSYRVSPEKTLQPGYCVPHYINADAQYQLRNFTHLPPYPNPPPNVDIQKQVSNAEYASNEMCPPPAYRVRSPEKTMQPLSFVPYHQTQLSTAESTNNEMSPPPAYNVSTTETTMQPPSYVPHYQNAVESQYETLNFNLAYQYQPLTIDIPNHKMEQLQNTLEIEPKNVTFTNDLNVYPTNYYPDQEFYHYTRPLYDDCVSSTNEINWSENQLGCNYSNQ